MPTKFVDIFSLCFHTLEYVAENGMLLQIDGGTTVDCPERYQNSPPVDVVEVRYYVTRCFRCQDPAQLFEKIAKAQDDDSARLAFEEHIVGDLQKLLVDMEEDGVRPQLRVFYDQDSRSISPELSVNEAVDLIWPLLSEVVEHTLRRAI
ncbi:hypothetical protein JDV02_003093 [Purpureocillium takamizusanense]|uniref:Uncharacterized protein n=1 Tax=Purpureocillium takamizusanense TaxID=2060973 RepID=A0A9Q8QCX9_9HYPO|nr:uncharacterized protein JDV02_003093 [Purpureocillium takamizusanense]UNI16679.1 hypothetical protein JDV02_003093 [Purpureocillium takamizusanense]